MPGPRGGVTTTFTAVAMAVTATSACLCCVVVVTATTEVHHNQPQPPTWCHQWCLMMNSLLPSGGHSGSINNLYETEPLIYRLIFLIKINISTHSTGIKSIGIPLNLCVISLMSVLVDALVFHSLWTQQQRRWRRESVFIWKLVPEELMSVFLVSGQDVSERDALLNTAINRERQQTNKHKQTNKHRARRWTRNQRINVCHESFLFYWTRRIRPVSGSFRLFNWSRLNWTIIIERQGEINNFKPINKVYRSDISHGL